MLIMHGSFKGLFVDLFVRKSNVVAIALYKKLGYSTFRTIQSYYSGDVPEDALGRQHVLYACMHV